MLLIKVLLISYCFYLTLHKLKKKSYLILFILLLFGCKNNSVENDLSNKKAVVENVVNLEKETVTVFNDSLKDTKCIDEVVSELKKTDFKGVFNKLCQFILSYH